jgi:hypothetical protein
MATADADGLGTRVGRRFTDLHVNLDDLRAADAPRAVDLAATAVDD